MSLEIRLQRAINDRRIAAYDPEELLPAVNRILLQTYVLVGFTPPKENDVALLTTKFSSDLQESYPSLTLQEVSLCFELGAKGEYGDFMGLNLRTFTRQAMVKQQAMAICLKRFFDGVIKEGGKGGFHDLGINIMPTTPISATIQKTSPDNA